MVPRIGSGTTPSGLQMRAAQVANLDCAAHTSMDPRVLSAMHQAAALQGNPHNRSHVLGRNAYTAIENGRRKIAEAIGASPNQILFTSGATEANNLALLGVARQLKRPGHLVTSMTEHASVLGPAAELEARGWSVTRIRPDRWGYIAPEMVERALRPTTVLISLMLVNNELGTLLAGSAISDLAKRYQVQFHCDAAQAFGRIPIDLSRLTASSLSLSGHKVHGPAGIGVLFLREPQAIEPIMFGGGQQLGIRPGTIPTALVLGMARAGQLAASEIDANSTKIVELCRYLRAGLEAIPGTKILSPSNSLASGIVSVALHGVVAEDLLSLIGNLVAASTGSACIAGDNRGSHVLTSIGIADDQKRSVIRLSISRETERWEVDLALRALDESTQWLRRCS